MIQHLRNVSVLTFFFLVILFSGFTFKEATSSLPKIDAIFIGGWSLLLFTISFFYVAYVFIVVLSGLYSKYRKPKFVPIPTSPFNTRIQDSNPYKSPVEF